MRINLEQGINNCQLIYDTYHNDWACLKNVLHFTNQQGFTLEKTLILSDVHQPDMSPEMLYDNIVQLLYTHKIGRLIGIGPQILAYAHKFQFLKSHLYVDIAAFINSQLFHTFNKNIVIVKGSKTCQLNELLNKLRQKCQETVLEIDLDAIEHNLKFFRSRLSKDTQVIAMLKASAYGSSSFEVAHFLQQNQVAYLSVAYVDEGVTLRESGITLPIMVMNPSAASFDKLVDYQLEPILYSLKILKEWQHFVTQKHISNNIIHIKLDTGMHRLGFMEKDIDQLVDILQLMPNVVIKTVFSHLSSPGNRRHNGFTHGQANLFQQLVKRIETRLGIYVLKHILNTAGAQYFPEYHFDMVRLGIGLYGFSKEIQHHLKIATTLKTIISQIKEVSAGTTIGYERKGIVHRHSKIGILPIGYADGFRRGLSNAVGKVWINGKLAPVIGNVCMDMTMVDITDIEAKEGDEVIIFGKVLSIKGMALALNTIVYEILTNVDDRIKRVCYKVLPACK